MLSKQQEMSIEDIESYHLTCCHPNCAGIDVGSRSHYVAISPVKAKVLGIPVVREFSATTTGLQECCEYLVECGVTDVAMESTGIYWRNLHMSLTRAGISAEVVNPRHFRMVPGRKTDVLDCQWLHTLHYYGLLRGSFIPDEKTQILRSLVRMRQKEVEESATHVNRIQKALVSMNLLLGNVVSDVTGKTGMSIIKSILSGERDPKRLALLRDKRCKSTEEEITEALNGNYRDDHIILLRLAVESYEHAQKQLAYLDEKITEVLSSLPDGATIIIEDGVVKDRNTWEVLGTLPEDLDLDKATISCSNIINEETGEILWARPAKPGTDSTSDEDAAQAKKKAAAKSSASKNALKTDVDIKELINRKAGVPICNMDGYGELTSLVMISEIGLDLTRFPDEKHLAAYLGLVPRNKITGGVVVSSRTDRIKHPAAIALKKVVPSLSKTDCPLSSRYHRNQASRGTGRAITAVARKMAENYYNCITHGYAYITNGEAKENEKREENKKRRLERLANQLGATITYNTEIS